MNDKKPLQLLLVVETNSEDKTDVIYINEVIKKYFDLSDINVQWITLGGKTHYKDKKITNKIKSLTRMFESNTNGKTVTIFFIDTDSSKAEYKEGSFFYNLSKYIKDSGFVKMLRMYFCTLNQMFWKTKQKPLKNSLLTMKLIS